MSIRDMYTRHRFAVGLAAGLVIAALTAAGVAVASIPSSKSGAITGCVSKGNGAVRIIDSQAGKHCRAGERTISWSKGYRYRGRWHVMARSPHGCICAVARPYAI